MDMAAAYLGMGVVWLWGVPSWDKLQHLLVVTGARMGVGQAGLGLTTC